MTARRRNLVAIILLLLGALATSALWISLTAPPARGEDIVPLATFETCGRAKPMVDSLAAQGFVPRGMGPAVGWGSLVKLERPADGVWVLLVFPADHSGMACIGFIGKDWQEVGRGS